MIIFALSPCIELLCYPEGEVIHQKKHQFVRVCALMRKTGEKYSFRQNFLITDELLPKTYTIILIIVSPVAALTHRVRPRRQRIDA